VEYTTMCNFFNRYQAERKELVSLEICQQMCSISSLKIYKWRAWSTEG